MRFRTLWRVTMLLLVLTLGASLAHLYALPNKIQMSRDEYLVAQKIYSGWILVGVANIGAVLCSVVLAIRSRHVPGVAVLNWIAAGAMCLGFAVFMTFTFPANQATQNWTVLVTGWESLRAQWEYSHATAALLYLLAFIALVLTVREEKEY